MATTPKQDKNFLDEVIGSTLLEKALEWIGENMEPEEVFDEAVLEVWADGHGMVFDATDK